MRRVHPLYCNPAAKCGLRKRRFPEWAQPLRRNAPFGPPLRIAMTCRISPKSEQISSGGNESVHYLHSAPGIFPGQPPHLTNLGGDAIRAWCVISAGCTNLIWRLILLEASEPGVERDRRSRLDLPIRQMFK